MKNLFLITLLLALSLTSFSQEGKWKKAQKKNTIETYQKFLVKYPDSEYSKDAQFKLIELEFEKAKSTNTIEGYKYFLDTYKENSFTELATSNLIDLEFEKAKSTNTIERSKYFLKTYKKTSYSDAVKTSLIDLEFEKAKKMNSIEGYNYFTNTYPNNKYITEVNTIVAGIDYKRAKSINTTESYNKYLNKYPNNEFSTLARSELAIKEYEIISNENSEEAELLSLCSKLEKLGVELDTLATHEDDYTSSAASFAKAAELFQTSGKIKMEINQNFKEQYKKSGYYYFRAASKCSSAELFAGLGSLSATLRSYNEDLDKGKSIKVEDLYYNYANAIAIPGLNKTLMYEKSVSVFREAGLDEHADWMMESGTLKSFTYEEIIE